MGLNRNFDLYFEKKNGNSLSKETRSAVLNKLNEITEYDWDSFWEDSFNICGASWYDWQDNMRKVAKEFPDVVFKLCCNGDYLDDIWIAGFCGDREDFQYARIPDLDMKFLRGD